MSIAMTLPLILFTVMIWPRLNGLVKIINIPANVFVKISLDAKPKVKPEMLNRDRSGFVSNPNVPNADNSKNAQKTVEHILDVMRNISGSIKNKERNPLKNLSINLVLDQDRFIIPTFGFESAAPEFGDSFLSGLGS